ncbi:TonB-dependent receptor [Aliiglaciecola sp. CAU 1673]|uniref:TonB-dependent receptor n=1 Tax=Aliiglaciecola sp. CAU 1673 TaxID=3032595 RepID=UPI0023DB5D5A|nr:TonB-dependent receptor [Aliiglaciecola sp. CAU 1673]MDF2176764.1 TonB-dependent receptor [Aliiglaciecola sp. CAU 1673]
MFNNSKLNRVALAVALAAGVSSGALAQETSSGINGKVLGPQGNAAANTKITITHVPSGTTRTVTTTEAGNFSAKGLRVGGPYRVEVDSDKFQDTAVSDIYLTLGDAYTLDLTLEEQQAIEAIVVTASRITGNYGQTGPSNNFDLTSLQAAPSASRDIKDVVRIDPRVYINEAGSDAIQCAGANPRFNSLTVDGVRMNDNFGLNSSGYPTERIPFSYDAIAQVAVELAPFDVQYGGFTACNINAVTKSGTNKVRGGVFYDYTSDSLKGDKLEGDKIATGDYTEKRYGFNVGAPLIEDTLFIFAAYEKLEGAQIFEYAPFDNGRVSQTEIDQIAQVARDVYGYEPGSLLPSMPVEDEKVLVKLDWNINDYHRANLVYNYNDGFSIDQSDSGSDRIALSNHFYERGAKFNSVVASLYSDWTDSFSTELRIGHSSLDNRQISIDQASGFAEAQVTVSNGVVVYIGPDDSRQANKLKYDNLSFKLAGTYYLDEHKLDFGYEFEELDVFNMFVQHTVGEYRFDNIDAFRNGVARVYYGNAASHNPLDAAGEFEYTLHTAYVQDEYSFSDVDLKVMFGLRYDWYSSDDLPKHNQNFEDRYGFSNSQNLDGKDLLQPRFGFNWAASDDVEIRGGFGLYSGGNPNVWISNSYSNDGVRNIQVNKRGMQLLGPNAVALTGQGNAIYDIPVELYNLVGGGLTDAGVDATDPNFEIPSEWKYALGLTYTSPDDYIVTADILYTDKQDSAIIKNLANVKVGEAPDGRPVYADTNHPGQSDLLLTNVEGKDGESTVFSVGVSKQYDNGVDMAFSYAFTEAKEVHPMTSSVAFSNYHRIDTADPENPGLARSNYEIPHRFTLNLAYTTQLFDGLDTKFSLFGQANEGRPYGYTFNTARNFLGFNDEPRQLLYVPLENDPNVVYTPAVYDEQGNLVSGFDLNAFNAFIESEGLTRGEILDRNALSSSWWVKFDVKVEQEFPGFYEDHKGSAYFVIKNIGNMINDDWGVLKEGGSLQPAVTAGINANNQYEYKEFLNPAGQSREITPSLWEVRLGVKYSF